MLNHSFHFPRFLLLDNLMNIFYFGNFMWLAVFFVFHKLIYTQVSNLNEDHPQTALKSYTAQRTRNAFILIISMSAWNWADFYLLIQRFKPQISEWHEWHSGMTSTDQPPYILIHFFLDFIVALTSRNLSPKLWTTQISRLNKALDVLIVSILRVCHRLESTST